jgi:hypothetical protein
MTDWAQVMTIIAANLAAIMWARKEAADDRRQFNVFMKDMRDEMKDFHGRMAAIEERRK